MQTISQPILTSEQLLSALMVNIYALLHISPKSLLRHPVDWITRQPLLRFCQMFVEADHTLSQKGIAATARWLLMSRFVRDICTHGQEQVPTSGPLVVVANHPGAYDSVAITASLGRDDLSIVASGIPFFKRLPTISQHLIFSTADTTVRMSVIRETIRHLQNGGAVLIFPTGHIDPDPSFMQGSAESVDGWSSSVEIFLRKVPETRLLPAVVSGVLSPRAIRHPLTRLESEGWKRQRVAELIQLFGQVLLPRQTLREPKISFGSPLNFYEIGARRATQSFKEFVASLEKRLIDEHVAFFYQEGKGLVND